MSWKVALRAELGSLQLDVALEGSDAPVALIGPNGSGKTSLLRWIAGQPMRASIGRLEVDGRALVDLDRRVAHPPEERGVGYVPQGFGLFDHLDVVDNVAFGLASRGVPKRERRERARELLSRLDAEALEARRIRGLSGGERQKVALARALVTSPRLLLLDEPMAALDASARRWMRGFLAETLAASEADAIVVTHDARDVRALAKTVFVMEAGRIVEHGAPEALAASPSSEFVAEFFDVPRGDHPASVAAS